MSIIDDIKLAYSDSGRIIGNITCSVSAFFLLKRFYDFGLSGFLNDVYRAWSDIFHPLVDVLFFWLPLLFNLRLSDIIKDAISLYILIGLTLTRGMSVGQERHLVHSITQFANRYGRAYEASQYFDDTVLKDEDYSYKEIADAYETRIRDLCDELNAHRGRSIWWQIRQAISVVLFFPVILLFGLIISVIETTRWISIKFEERTIPKGPTTSAVYQRPLLFFPAVFTLRAFIANAICMGIYVAVMLALNAAES